MKKTRQSYLPSSPLKMALEHHQAGRMSQAEALYKTLPHNPEALHLLGVLHYQRESHADALISINQAIRLAPANADYYYSIELVYRALHRLNQVADSYRQLLQHQPDCVNAHCNLGHALKDAGQFQSALGSYLNVLALQPDNAAAYSHLAATLKALGNLDEAEECYLKSLALQPNYPEAHNNLGNMYKEQGKLEQAVVRFESALALKPELAEAHYNLGVIRQAQGKIDEAIASYQTATALKPDFSAPHNNLGTAYKALDKLDDAILSYRRALAIQPDFVEALNNLGGALNDQKKVDEAIALFEQALTLQPNYAEAYHNLGIAYKAQYRQEEAILCFENAVHLKPDYADAYSMLAVAYSDVGNHGAALALCEKTLSLWPDSPAAHYNLGVAFSNLSKVAEAISCFQQAIALKPEFVDAYNNLGVAFTEQGKLNEAITLFKQALEIRPTFAEAHNNLGRAIKDQGMPDESRRHYEQAIALDPNYTAAHDNLLLSMQYSATIGPQELFDLHLRYGAQFEPELKPLWFQHENSRDPTKRLKIGYVSPDFRQHAVAYFIGPVLAHHDKTQVDVFCYYSHTVHDVFTDRIKASADHWRPCKSLSDAQLAAQIHADGIDILVDLAGHTGGNRLLAFARKPAPVQLTFLGYPATTGLTAMDYRLSDAYAEPVGMTEQWNVEQLWRLPEIFCCYAAHPNSPAVIDHPPFEDNGYVTFGCFNNYAKVTDPVIALWAKILDHIPTSRLMLEIHGLDSPDFKAGVETRFARLGIPAERLILITQDKKNQFVLYNRIDLALDPFPCNGGTTSFDTLWMGVPFVTLAGGNFISRLGVTILQNGGLAQLIAETEEEYIHIATGLANDKARLKTLRQGLRERTQTSPLMDMARFTTHLEQAYREMWKVWCESDNTERTHA